MSEPYVYIFTWYFYTSATPSPVPIPCGTLRQWWERHKVIVIYWKQQWLNK